MTDGEIYEDNLRHFQVIRRHGDSAQCRCPSHPDKQASLTVSKGRKCTLIHCHAGCQLNDILQAAGLKKQDLFYESESQRTDWKRYIERREKRKIEAIYDYVSSVTGAYAFTKIRLEGKKMLYGIIENNRFSYGLRGQNRKQLKAVYGNLEAIRKAIKEGRPIFIPEGEKDCDTLKKQGYTAFSYGGVNDWQSDFAELLRDANVIILADNDAPGKTVAQRIYDDLAGIAKSRKVVVPMPDIEKADISDYFEAGHNRDEFEKMIKENTLQKNRTAAAVGSPKYILEQLNALRAAERFQMNDKGSADLFATIFKNISRYNPTRKDWMYYDKTRWIADTEGMRAKRNAKRLADVLVRYSVTASLPDDKRQSYIKYAAGMMNYRNRNVMITDAKDLNFFENTELDKNDFLLNCKNCVLDLSGDQPKVLEHSADLLLSKICNANYNPAATCTLWEKTVNEIMQGDIAKIKYLQKMSGRFLTGDTSEEEFYIFFGATTRNGKSTITEILLYLLGDYATTISPESLAVKANKDSRTASPDIAKLAGTRLVVASEPPRRMLFDSSLVKTLTGRDTITARFLHENEFQFRPKFKLILNSNYLPVINDKTVFSSNRVKVVPFERHFTEKEQNKHLKEQLQQEIDGILNWCIQGLQLYRKEGLQPPTAVQTATHEYSEDSDKTGKFISECLIKSDQNLAAKDVYEKYSQWCNDCGLGIDGRTSFYEELKTKNLLSKTGTVTGKTVKNVVKGYSFVDEVFQSVENNLETPFT